MTHIVDDSKLLALLDGELPSGEAESVRDHLDECPRCRRRYGDVEERSRLFSRGTDLLDVEPSLAWNEIVERAEGAAHEEEAPLPSPGRAAPFLKAAVILLAVTGVAAAIPGSPVDDWIGQAVERFTGWIGGEEPTGTRTPEAAVHETAAPGVAVALEGGRVIVTLEETAPGTRVEVTLSDETRAEIQAAGARYRTSPGRIEAVGASGEAIRIRLPEIATSARILVNGEPAVVLLDSGRLRLLLGDRVESDSSVSFRIPGGSPDG